MLENLKQSDTKDIVVNEEIAKETTFDATQEAMLDAEIQTILNELDEFESVSEKATKDFVNLLDNPDGPGIPPFGEIWDKVKYAVRHRRNVHHVVVMGPGSVKNVEKIIKINDVEKILKKTVDHFDEMANIKTIWWPVLWAIDLENGVMSSIAESISSTWNLTKDVAEKVKNLIQSKWKSLFKPEKWIEVINNSKDELNSIAKKIMNAIEWKSYNELISDPNYKNYVWFFCTAFSIRYFGNVQPVDVETIQRLLNINPDWKAGPEFFGAVSKYLWI